MAEREPDYAVAKVIMARGRWQAQAPLRFSDRETALQFAREAAEEQRAARSKGDPGMRIVVTQGARLIREYKV